VMKLRASDGARLGKIGVGAFPFKLGFDGIKLWIASSGGNVVYLARATDGVLLGTANDNCYPCGGMAFDGNQMWLSDYGTDHVRRFRAKDATSTGGVATGFQPAGVLFDGTSIWVANSADNTVSKISRAQ